MKKRGHKFDSDSNRNYRERTPMITGTTGAHGAARVAGRTWLFAVASAILSPASQPTIAAPVVCEVMAGRTHVEHGVVCGGLRITAARTVGVVPPTP